VEDAHPALWAGKSSSRRRIVTPSVGIAEDHDDRQGANSLCAMGGTILA
jgi:hypothetical protein